MTEMHIENAPPPSIMLETTTEQKPIATRKQEAEQRKADFYKQLEDARNVPQEETVRRENRHTEEEIREIRVDSAENAQTEIEEDNELDNKLIPKKRFDKELEKRKVLEDELRRERDSRIKFETELTLYNKAIESMNEQQHSKEVEPQLDPIDSDAHSYYMNKIKELESKFESQKTNLTDYEVKQNFANTVNYQAAEITKTHPDFNDAYNYVLQVESNKGRMLGMDETQAQAYALSQIQPIAWQAYNKGQNVAEVAYNIAKSYGYQSKNPTVKDSLVVAPNFDKIEKNMAKSYTALDEIKGVGTGVSKETAAYNTLEGFTRKLGGKNGRGTNTTEFAKALEKVRNSSSY